MADPSSLSNLRDIVEPTIISFWPPAPGLVLIGALILLWTSVAVLLWWRRWQQNAYRRAALHELTDIEKQIRSIETRADAIRQLSLLTKRVALAAYPRGEVASLTGHKWISFLDQHMDGDLFSQDPVRMLATATAESNPGASLTSSDCYRLIQAVQRWITRHRVEDNPSTTRTGM